MSTTFDGNISEPASLAVRRNISLFAEDLEANVAELTDAIQGKKILVIGGAGSIGSNTIQTISQFAPAALHVVDQNENGLAELVRSLRSRSLGLKIDDFQTLPLNYGNPSFYHFIRRNDYDAVLNFAALKHVRSEKDPFSIMEMLNTNLLLMTDLMEELSKGNSPERFFSVSTDKAANPSSIMGASKRLMEHFLFDRSLVKPEKMAICSARFANVAYSNGSLLKSFDTRLSAKQPLVAPKGCERYFVSLEESGHICTLAAFLAPADSIVIPNLNPVEHLILLENVLFDYLRFHGLEPRIFKDEVEARGSVVECESRGEWPVLLPPLDTAGEKPYEEFASELEQVFNIGFKELSGVEYLPPQAGNVLELKQKLNDLIRTKNHLADEALDKSVFKQLISALEPAFMQTHRESKSNLDQRM